MYVHNTCTVNNYMLLHQSRCYILYSRLLLNILQISIKATGGNVYLHDVLITAPAEPVGQLTVIDDRGRQNLFH